MHGARLLSAGTIGARLLIALLHDEFAVPINVRVILDLRVSGHVAPEDIGSYE
jgi:hypothetical protein